MIPKVIHYFWLGGNALPPLVERCIQTWHEKLPDYEIKRWDESNSDLSNELVQYAIKTKRWAFAVDYLRLKILYEQGGIYLDTDMEMVAAFKEDMLDASAFLGYECERFVSAGVIGAAQGSVYIKDCIAEMEGSFRTGGFETIPRILTRVYKAAQYADVVVYPPVVFYPFNPYAKDSTVQQLMYCDVKANTIAIHHWHKGWKLSFLAKVTKKITMLFRGLK